MNSNGGNGKTSPFGDGMGGIGTPGRAATDLVVNATGSSGGKTASTEVERQLTTGGVPQKANGDQSSGEGNAPSALPFDQPRNPARQVGVGGQSGGKSPFRLGK